VSFSTAKLRRSFFFAEAGRGTAGYREPCPKTFFSSKSDACPIRTAHLFKMYAYEMYAI
jgi:hypothetical protein